MGEKIAAIFGLLFVLLLGLGMLSAVGAFLYLIFGGPISTLVDKIKEKKRKKVLDESKLLKGIKEVNSSFSYEPIKAEYYFTKECRSRKEYNRTTTIDYLHTVLNRERALIRELENAVQYNQTVILDYEQKCEDLLTRFSSDPTVEQKYRRTELEMFEKEKLYIGTSYVFKITVSFLTPQRRNHYSSTKAFSRDMILEEMKKIKEDKKASKEEEIARKKRLAEMEYERSLMSAKLRYDVLKRDNYRCVVCGASASDGVTQLHVDHIIPIAKGGKTEMSNLQTLCQRCNLGKGTSD